MGIKDFSKVFTYARKVKYKDLKGKCLAVDAFYEIYRAALGARSVTTLTDASGNSTMHISVILALVLNLRTNGIDQIWIFDPCQNPAKLDEMLKRQQKKQVAELKLADLLKKEALFDDDVKTDSCDTSIQPTIASMPNQGNTNQQATIDALTKRCFSIDERMINDVKLILTSLHIKYVEAPTGFEAEQIAAYLSATDQVDGVLSDDTDVIPFGAKVQYRRDRTSKSPLLLEYTQSNILGQIRQGLFKHNLITYKKTLKGIAWSRKVDISYIRKICVMLGSDFAPKTAGVGPKTVFKHFDNVELSEKQQQALDVFAKEPDGDIETYNFDKLPFISDNRAALMDWLVNERSFARSRINKQFAKLK